MDNNLSSSNVKPGIWQAIGFLAVLFLALLVLDKAYSVWHNFKPAVPKNTISMSAEGKVAATPDLATVTVGVTSRASTAKAAQEDMTKKTNQIIDFVKSQGVDAKDITTTNFSVYQEYDYDYTQGGRETPKGYVGNQTVSIKVHGVDKSADKVSTILDGASANGSNQIQGVYFSFEDADNLKQEARKQAIEKAKQKAQELAQASGIRLGRVVSISDSSVGYPYPIPYATEGRGVALDGKAVPPTIEPGSQDISVSITLTFEVK